MLYRLFMVKQFIVMVNSLCCDRIGLSQTHEYLGL